MTQDLRQFARLHIAKSRCTHAHTELTKHKGWTYQSLTSTFAKQIEYPRRAAEVEALNVAAFLKTTTLCDAMIVMSVGTWWLNEGKDAYNFERAFVLCAGDAYEVAPADLDRHEIKPFSAPLDLLSKKAHKEMLHKLTERSNMAKLELTDEGGALNNQRQMLHECLKGHRNIKKNYATTLQTIAREIAEKDAAGEDASEHIAQRERVIVQRDEDVEWSAGMVANHSHEVKCGALAGDIAHELLRRWDAGVADKSLEVVTVTEGERVTELVHETARSIAEKLDENTTTAYLLGSRKLELLKDVDLQALITQGRERGEV